MNWLQKISELNSAQILQSLAAEMARRAQIVYDQWDQSDPEYGDPELGFGGICDGIAEQIAEVINERTPFDAKTTYSDEHTSVVVRVPEGVYGIDIYHGEYETGAAYTWQKIEGVQFDASLVAVYHISSNPAVFEEFEY